MSARGGRRNARYRATVAPEVVKGRLRARSKQQTWMKVNNFCAHLECFSIYCDKKDHPQEEVARRVTVYLSPPSAGGRCYKLRTSDPNISIPTREFGVLVKGRPQIVEETISDDEIDSACPSSLKLSKHEKPQPRQDLPRR